MDLNEIGDDIFKPFMKFNKKTEGRGIGLHIVKGMVEKNGGCIKVKSRPGEGTCFEVFLKEY
jgi:signal transduction histidine kinase